MRFTHGSKRCFAQIALLAGGRRRYIRVLIFALQQLSGHLPCPHSAIAEPAAGTAPAVSPPLRASFWALTLGSIGVVYGDIGTSPLYAVRESVLAAVGPNAPASEPVVLGILSLIIWALLLVVTAKYVLILLRADNNGEGGTLALMALASRALARPRRLHRLARHHQRRAVLWRRHHHAGAVGALGRSRA